MKFISLFTRLGLLALGFILVAVLNDDSVWADPATTTPTTAGLADSLLSEWGFALLVLGLLMAMAMMGAAYLFVMNAWRTSFGSSEGKKNDRSSVGFRFVSTSVRHWTGRCVHPKERHHRPDVH